MFDIIWGVKTVAILDAWSIEHLLSGMSVGFFVSDFNKNLLLKYNIPNPSIFLKKHMDFVAIFFLAFLWETVEHYLEEGLAGDWVAYWFQGVEFWPNRLIFDPLIMYLGFLIIGRFPKFIFLARILSFFWLFVHLFIFPHSMYLHDLF
tara:strand:- start:97 stop:540 length:444 start_codon:yes stop_codon:yes gene_type:complete